MLKKHRQKGFTIVEMLVYMGLFSILLLIISQIFTSLLQVHAESSTNAALTQDARYLITRLEYDVSRASNISVPATTSGTTSSLSLVINGTTNTYALSSGVLQLTNANGTFDLTSSETTISAMTFQKISNVGGKSTVQVKFTMKGLALSNKQETESFQTTVGRR